MPLYRRKPTTVEAEQFTDYVRPCAGIKIRYDRPSPTAYVTTMQGRDVDVELGEWIVKEASGVGYYPIADEEFRRIYELA